MNRNLRKTSNEHKDQMLESFSDSKQKLKITKKTQKGRENYNIFQNR